MSAESASRELSNATGVIHDIGYQRYTGPRLGRGYSSRALFTHALRASYGFGRSAKAKIFPWIMVGIPVMVALLVTAIRSETDEVAIGYTAFPGEMVVFVILFSAVVAPELVSRDLRSGVLPLYFSRPLTRADYALAKLGALIVALFLMLAGPQLVMFAGGAFTLDSPHAVWHEFVDFSRGLAMSAMYALLFGSISLLIASFSGRRAVAAAMVV